uniref:Hepcidin-1 n=1 Tax=Plecoglossus altivelis TaxID=61084 RepID=F4MK96_PLEAT|nr:Hepcidin-1 [Plecoglossus altivelis]
MKAFSVAFAMVLVLARTCIFSSYALPYSEKPEQERSSLVLEHQQVEDHSQNSFAATRVRRQSHLSLCRWCCKCCHNKGCGFCCKF